MKFQFFISFLFIALGSSVSWSQTPKNDRNWNQEPFFYDDFNNIDQWVTDFVWGNYSAGDPCIYLPSQVKTENSILTFTAEKHQQIDNPKIQFKTGTISTKSADFGYGFYEIRCRLNSRGGRYMPAFWLWNASDCDCSDNGNACKNGWYQEIDFFEVFCDDFSLTSNIHAKNATCTVWNSFESSMDNPDFAENFYTFSYEWTPERIICYLNGEVYRIIAHENVPDKLLRLVIQLGFKDGKEVQTPGYMETDYVRVHTLKFDPVAEKITNFNSQSHSDFAVKKSIEIIGEGIIKKGDQVTLRSEEGLIIQGDLSIEAGAEFLFLPTKCPKN